MAWPAPVTLSDKDVTLVPLSLDHVEDLKAASDDGNLSDLWYTSVPHPDDMTAAVQKRLDMQAAGTMTPFAIQTPDGQTVGMTTYCNVSPANRRVEIGYTWYRKSVQRGPMNTQAKRLLLTHAFDTLECISVVFCTHFMNHQSRRAIERLGAKLDGVLRSHQILPDGTLRDTCVYSITAAEWPTVRAHLNHKVGHPL
jgi:RimJ/RimL family protein N-acetyltransferase